MSISDTVRLPEVMVFAGSNGSEKSTITRMARIVGEYINADDIKKQLCVRIWRRQSKQRNYENR